MSRNWLRLILIVKPKAGLKPIPTAFPHRNILSISNRLCTTWAFNIHNNHHFNFYFSLYINHIKDLLYRYFRSPQKTSK